VRKVGPLYERATDAAGVDGPLTGLGFVRAGVFEVGKTVTAAVWVRPEEGMYAVVWNHLLGPWVEMVAVGADGIARRVSQLTGSAGVGRRVSPLTDSAGAGGFARASGPGTDVIGLHERCRALAAGVPCAEVMPDKVAGLVSAHLVAEPDWWARVREASAVLAAEGGKGGTAEVRRSVAFGLILLVAVMAILVAFPLARWLGFGDRVPEWVESVAIFALVGWTMIWPTIRGSWESARGEVAAERAGAAGGSAPGV
jgi:hypothetical protein